MIEIVKSTYLIIMICKLGMEYENLILLLVLNINQKLKNILEYLIFQ